MSEYGRDGVLIPLRSDGNELQALRLECAQLRQALQSRIVIEQAKGVVAHTHDLGMDAAFNLIRSYARSHQLSVSSVAARLVDMTLTLDDESQQR